MIPIPTDATNRELGPPKNWNEERDGPCMIVPIQDMDIGEMGNLQVSTWMPTGDEWNEIIAKRNRGENPCFRLGIHGHVHPVIRVWVE